MTLGVVWQIHVHTGTYPTALPASSRNGKEVYRPGVGGGDGSDGGSGGGGGGGGAGKAGLVNRSRNARR